MSARHSRRCLQTRDLYPVAHILVRLIAGISGRSIRVALVTLVGHDDVRSVLSLRSLSSKKEAIGLLTSLRSHLRDSRQELVARGGLECLRHAFLHLAGESAIADGLNVSIFSVVVASGRETRHGRYSTSAGSDGVPLETALNVRLDFSVLLVVILLSLARSNAVTEV